jgi:hypothetical protein
VAGSVLDATLPPAAFLPTSTVHCRVCGAPRRSGTARGVSGRARQGLDRPRKIAAMGTLIVASSAMATCSSPTDAGFAGRAGVGDRDRRLHPALECSTCH